MQFDLEALKQVPIDEVLEALGARYPKGARPGRRQFNMHCFGPTHKKDDAHPSLAVWTDKNICKCFVCSDVKGDPVSVAKAAFNGDFKQACEWLHSTWGIPYKTEERGIKGAIKKVIKKVVAPTPPKREKKEYKVEYWSYDRKRGYEKVKIKDILPLYPKMNKAQRLKTVYTFIYRYSRNTPQKLKEEYYASRGIEHPAIEQIGTLSWENIEQLQKLLHKYFPIEDLVEFKVIKPADAPKRPLEWRYYNPKGFTVVPSFDLYSDMVTGLMLRPVEKLEGMRAKEFNVSNPEVCIPLPFGLDRSLLAKSGSIFVTEGHIDALSLPQTFDFIAIPGVQNIKDEWLGLLKGRECIIAFDQDNAGQNSAKELKERLQNAGAIVDILNWDKRLGKDLNEVLISGNMKKIL